MKKTFISILVLVISLTALAAQPAPGPKPARSQNKLMSEGAVSVNSISMSKNGDIYQIDFDFSGPVAPQSLSGKSVLINGKPLPPGVKISFNREGTRARFTIETAEEITRIELSGIKALDGQQIPPASQRF